MLRAVPLYWACLNSFSASILVAAAYASRRGLGKIRGWVLTHMENVKKGFSLFVLLLGMAILTGDDKWLEAKLENFLPEGWINLTTRF